jgi:hypothetical protein
MNTATIIEQIDEEISRLRQAKVLLEGTEIKRAAGRPKKNPLVSPSLSVAPVKRVVSAEAKAKMAEAQNRRWAKVRRAEKKAAKVAQAKEAVTAARPAKAVKAVKEVKPTPETKS